MWRWVGVRAGRGGRRDAGILYYGICFENSVLGRDPTLLNISRKGGLRCGPPGAGGKDCYF